MKTNYNDSSIDRIVANSLAAQFKEITEDEALEFLKDMPEHLPEESPLLNLLPETLPKLNDDVISRNLRKSIPLTVLMAMNRDNEVNEFGSATEDEISRARTSARKRLMNARNE